MSERPTICNGALCRSCRDRVRGKSTRTIVGKRLGLPLFQTEFDCPFGVPYRDDIKPDAPGASTGTASYRQPMPISDDFDPEAERRRLRQGGCCDPPKAIEN